MICLFVLWPLSVLQLQRSGVCVCVASYLVHAGTVCALLLQGSQEGLLGNDDL